MATPDYVAKMLATNSPGQRRIAEGPIGVGLPDGLRTLYAAVPIGYRVESYAPDRARVLTWGFTLLGNASSVEPAAYFGLTHTDAALDAGPAGESPKRAAASDRRRSWRLRPGRSAAIEVIDLANAPAEL